MEESKNIKTPVKTLVGMQIVHLGKILFNLQFIAVAIMVASVVSFIIPAIYYLLLICAMFLSLFTLLLNDTFMSMWSGGEALTNVTTALMQSWNYTVPIVLVLAGASIVCLCFDKREKHPARITISAILCGLALIVLVLKLINNGGAQ